MKYVTIKFDLGVCYREHIAHLWANTLLYLIILKNKKQKPTNKNIKPYPKYKQKYQANVLFVFFNEKIAKIC